MNGAFIHAPPSVLPYRSSPSCLTVVAQCQCPPTASLRRPRRTAFFRCALFACSNRFSSPPSGNGSASHSYHSTVPVHASANEPSMHAFHPSPVRIMFLISDTGGGHRASAQALSAAFDQLYPGRIKSMIVDFWTEIVGQPFHTFPEGYSFLAKNPALWRAAWQYGRFPLTRRLTEEFANAVGNDKFRRAVCAFAPHLIVSVHPLTQFIPLRVLRTLHRRPAFVTVCTDLGGAHPTWFHREADLCFVPTERVRQIALRCGLKQSQLRQFGLPVRRPFWEDAREKHAVRAQLRLVKEVPTVLVVGGGDGVGGVGRIAVSIAERVHRRLGACGAQLVVVCGKNERLKQQLLRRSWPVSVHVKGFVHNMSEWMAASDVIVSKAGPGTIAEALIRGLPIVLSGFLPGQEAPNVEFVTRSGVGTFSRDPSTIGRIVSEWVADPTALAERSRRARRLGRPNATYDIVREMGKLVRLEVSDAVYAKWK